MPTDSRTRILNSISRKSVDHTPLYLRFWPMLQDEDTIPFPWRDQIARAAYMTDLGLDDTLLIQPPLGYIEEYEADSLPGIASAVTVAETGGRKILEKTYTTPDGVLRHVVGHTDDWIYGDDIALFSDFNVPRAVHHIVNDADDIKRLRHLLGRPGGSQVAQFRQNAAHIRKEAEKLGVAVDGGWCALGDAAVMLCGMERVLTAQMDEPEFLEALLDVLAEWELMRLDYLLEEGIDVLVHMAWYEGTDFWTPANYRRMLAPRIRQLADKAHSRGVKFRYILTKGMKPLMEDIVGMGVDCIAGVDPLQDRIDLKEMKGKYGDRICMMGGVNSAVMLTRFSEEQIRSAVREAMEIMSPGSGFILYPVDAIFNNLPWGNVETLIDEWRKCKNSAMYGGGNTLKEENR
jgi:uroporphyrinogen-III decarboxylase